MGDFSAGRWVFILVIYFLVFFLFTVSYVNFLNDSNTPHNITRTGGDFFSVGANPFATSIDGVCERPRELLGSDLASFLGDSLECYYTHATTADTCNAIEGCTFQNTTTFLWFWESSVPEYCGGRINASAYAGENQTVLITWSGSTLSQPRSVCSLEGVQNENLCSLMGCTWITRDDLIERATEDTIRFGTVWGTVKLIATFNVSFGLSASMSVLFSLIAFWLPLVGLIIALYFSLPFIH